MDSLHLIQAFTRSGEGINGQQYVFELSKTLPVRGDRGKPDFEIIVDDVIVNRLVNMMEIMAFDAHKGKA